MTLFDDLALVDRCMVCGGERPGRERRSLTAAIGGAYAEMKIAVEYCADDSNCGEAEAMVLLDRLMAPFVVEDLRRRHYSLLDLGIVE